MALMTLHDISIAYGDKPLLDHQNMEIDTGERICIVGRNGEGKSTLLKIIAGHIQPDDGEIITADTVRVAMMPQDVPDHLPGTVYDQVAAGAGDIGALLKQHHALTHQLAEQPDNARLLSELEQVQQALDARDGWRLSNQVDTLITEMNLPAETPFDALSGGLKRRVLLGQALVQQPDILLLDEPTNHLDIPSIEWLEKFLKSLDIALVFITHDRAFLERLATRIVELDRGMLRSYPGDWNNYLRRKAEQLAAEEKANAEFDKKLAREEAWIRQGIKARRTRNEGRVRALKALREAAANRRKRKGKAQISVNAAEESGKKVIEVEGLHYAIDGRPIVQDFSTLILRGDKVGIIGPNGCGKTTLLKLLLGQLKPDRGKVKLGTRLEIAYFDQHREQLDPNKTVADAVVDDSDWVQIGERKVHVMRYIQDFLFSPERARQPVSALSGGERNRLLLARVFARPSNLLVLDEPTNDLDMETLELLEEKLLEYPGTLLLVSHDRAFIDNVVTSTLVFDAPGVVNEYVGGYSDWLRQRPKNASDAWETPGKKSAQKTASQKVGDPLPTRRKAQPPKLTYREQQEYDTLPDTLEQLEADIEQLHQQLADPAVFADGAAVKALQAQLAEKEQALEAAFERWEALEAKYQAWRAAKNG